MTNSSTTPLSSRAAISDYEDLLAEDSQPKHPLLTHQTNSVSQNTHQQHYLATHDLLTGLHNEKVFIERVSHEIKYCERYHFKFALLLLNINNFHLINENLGITIGDYVLREAANRIKSSVRSTDTVARWKADQFLLLTNNITSAAEAAKIAYKILASFTQPLVLDQQEYYIQANIAICLYPEDGECYELLFQRLCNTLQNIKQNGETPCQFYDFNTTQQIHHQVDVENELKRLLFRNDVEINYQPILDVRCGHIDQLKANLVWESDIIPSSVIKLFNDDLLEFPIVDGIGDWLLYSICQQMEKWRTQDVKDYRVAVDISSQQFTNFHLTEKIQRSLDETGISPERLIIEVKEQTVIMNKDRALNTLIRLKELGIMVTLCNFGHGQTHLSLLKELPIDFIKLAPTHIDSIENSRADQAIVRGILALCAGLEKTVIAQGVKTITQLNILSELNCKLMQGPIIHNALDSDAVATL